MVIIFDVDGTKRVLAQGKEATMRSVIMPLVWLILLILVLPSNTPLTRASEPDQTAESANARRDPAAEKPIQEIDSIILTECPSAFELPLMLGRPAPCLATFSTNPD